MINPRATRSIAFLAGCAMLAPTACETQRGGALTPAARTAIADSLGKLATSAYDLSRPNPVQRMMSLYPERGPIYSTSSGHVSTTRAALQQQIESFWKYVGSNMRNPKWEWTSMHVDVLSPEAAVMTASYRIPHLNPRNVPHVIGGAWTAAFVNRGGRWVVIQEHLSDTPAP
ncbi:MAG: hypothetical protein ABIR58_08080 [Gemmatimonadaceae bacterium]